MLPIRWVVVSASFLAVPCHLQAAVVTAKSPSFEAVSSAVESTDHGDIVVVPAGSASWTSTVNITHGITLQGADNDKTVTVDNIPRRVGGRPARFQPEYYES